FLRRLLTVNFRQSRLPTDWIAIETNQGTHSLAKNLSSDMGAANSLQKLTIDTVALLEQLEPNMSEKLHKRQVQARVQTVLAREWPTCKILAFGSSENGFGFGGSDLDLGLYFEDVDVDCQGHFSPQEKVEVLTKACALLYTEFEVKQFIPNARVPILKLWDKQHQVACDLCVGGVHALLNTALLKYYGKLDPRVRPLAFAVKYWAKCRGINDSANGTLSSYAFTMLLIFYLQSRSTKRLLPCAQSLFTQLHKEKKVSALLEYLDELPMLNLDATFGTASEDSVGALLGGFFQFYATEFNIDDDVVSVRTGSPLFKTTKWSRPVQWRISIEDPFELMHDVGRVIFNKKGQEVISKEFHRAYSMVSMGKRLEEICALDELAWHLNASCYICDSTSHKARECAQATFRSDTSATRISSFSPLSDCWYCGEAGHYKAACPLICFTSIPIEGFAAVEKKMPLSTSVATTVATYLDLRNHHRKTKATHPSSPIRPPMKKKRARAFGSPSVSVVRCTQPAARSTSVSTRATGGSGTDCESAGQSTMSVRRNVRLRREYLYRKGLEGKERSLYEHKQQLKEAIREGKPIPTELRGSEKSLRHEIEYDDEVHEKPINVIDDEYKNAGMFDPKIAVTTSRDPSARLKQFAQEIRLIFPNAIRLNRGAHTIGDLVESARSHEYTDLILLTETRGEPDGMTVCHLPYGPTAYFSLSNAVLRHDIEDRATISEAYPHIILNNFETSLGRRVSNILKHLFPVPKADSKRVITLSNDSDYISFRHHVFKKSGREVELQECGPRFELQLYQVKLGTLDQKEAENEWVLRPYMNSAKKRRLL
ncbi:TPA: hypothetical protein N0F65_007202, partial [Lagenidium giganteum]